MNIAVLMASMIAVNKNTLGDIHFYLEILCLVSLLVFVCLHNQRMRLQEHCFQEIVIHLLGDEDARVRTAASSTIIRLDYLSIKCSSQVSTVSYLFL